MLVKTLLGSRTPINSGCQAGLLSPTTLAHTEQALTSHEPHPDSHKCNICVAEDSLLKKRSRGSTLHETAEGACGKATVTALEQRMYSKICLVSLTAE